MYVRSLQKAGYDVTWVVDGNDGLVAARNQNFDLIILDLMLPEQRGDQILDALRNNNVDLVPNSKILIMTNFEQDEASRKSVMSRVDGYLIKADITPRNLIEVVKQMSSDD
jgi:DNA-binding response OmpR family regulator